MAPWSPYLIPLTRYQTSPCPLLNSSTTVFFCSLNIPLAVAVSSGHNDFLPEIYLANFLTFSIIIFFTTLTYSSLPSPTLSSFLFIFFFLFFIHSTNRSKTYFTNLPYYVTQHSRIKLQDLVMLIDVSQASRRENI